MTTQVQSNDTADLALPTLASSSSRSCSIVENVKPPLRRLTAAGYHILDSYFHAVTRYPSAIECESLAERVRRVPHCEFYDADRVVKYFHKKRYTAFTLESLDTSSRVQLDILLATDSYPTRSTAREWADALKIRSVAAMQYAVEWRKRMWSSVSITAESGNSLVSKPHDPEHVEGPTSPQRASTCPLTESTGCAKAMAGLENERVASDCTSVRAGGHETLEDSADPKTNSNSTPVALSESRTSDSLLATPDMAELVDRLSVALSPHTTSIRPEDAPYIPTNLLALSKWLEDGASMSSAFLDDVSKGKYASIGLHAALETP